MFTGVNGEQEEFCGPTHAPLEQVNCTEPV